MNAAYQKLCARLMMAGVPDARFDAVQLYKFVTGRDPRLDNGPTPDEASSLRVLGERRAAREPLQYLLGEWEFFGLPFFVGEGVLIPQPDTETLVETALGLMEGTPSPVVADLCAGSGCVGISIAHMRPDARVYALELSEAAFPYLARNIERNGAPVEALLCDALAPPALPPRRSSQRQTRMKSLRSG